MAPAPATALHFIACGAVDDGKSTLMGRLLYESGALPDDQFAELQAAQRRQRRPDGEIDFAWLLDGLGAEREQGITIDVAYRYFSTAHRRFTIADAPGHPQYTRNMVTGASLAEVAVLVVDARKGVQPQTQRHAHLAALLGIRQVALAVNKMDLVDYDEATFRQIADEFRSFAADLPLEGITCLPVCATRGDNVARPSERLPWHQGTTLLGFLETVAGRDDRLRHQPLRLPVQWVCRPAGDFRGFAGTVAGGTLHVGDAVRVLPGGSVSHVARIVTAQGDLEHAGTGEAVMVTLADDLDVSRGDLLCAASAPATCADQFECTLVWMDEDAALPGRAYLLKTAGNTVNAQITGIKYEIDVGSTRHLAARQLELNALAVCNLALDRPVPFEPFRDNATLGAFVLIDRLNHRTVGAGMLHFALRRSQTLQTQPFDVDKAMRSVLKRQRPCLVWLTGLSGAGKSAIANALEARLVSLGHHTYLLDGDNVRQGLNKDLGFDAPDRVENIRRAGEVARLMVDAGLIVIAAFISPFRAERERLRSLVDAGEFVEVFVDTPLEEAERRDPRGLYRRARRGELKNVSGITLAYEPPLRPEVHLDTAHQEPNAAAEAIIAVLRQKGVLADR